jgi:hypothetical protein
MSHDWLARPVDPVVFGEAVEEIAQDVMRPFVVTPIAKRPSVHLTDTGEVVTLNTDHPIARMLEATRRFCETRGIHKEWIEPIAIRTHAYWAVIHELRGAEELRPYIRVDGEGHVTGIRHEVTVIAASFPMCPGVGRFDPEKFLQEILKRGQDPGPAT